MISSQKLGLTISGISILIIILLFVVGVQYQAKQKTMCETACGESDSCTMLTCPYHGDDNTLFIVGLVSTLTAFVGGIGLYLIFRSEEKLVQQKEYDLTPLSEEEQKIFLFIKDHKEGIFQSSLHEQFNLSKVQTTRILDKLEQHSLIERKRRGMTNLIVAK